MPAPAGPGFFLLAPSKYKVNNFSYLIGTIYKFFG